MLPSSGDALDDIAAELAGTSHSGREQRLREALGTLGDAYQLVLIDSPPALNILTINGLTAAHRVLVGDGVVVLRLVGPHDQGASRPGRPLRSGLLVR